MLRISSGLSSGSHWVVAFNPRRKEMDKNEYDIYNQLSGLFCNIKKGSGAAVLSELYDFLKKFPKVAPFNLALVSAQRPGAGYFANSKRQYQDAIMRSAHITTRIIGNREHVLQMKKTLKMI